MFYIEEHGQGSWKVVEVPEPRHSSYKFMRSYPTRTAAIRAMLVHYYQWPAEMADFAIAQNLPLDFQGVKKTLEDSQRCQPHSTEGLAYGERS